MTNHNQLMDLIKLKLLPDMHIFEERFYPIDGLEYRRDIAIEAKCRTEFYWYVMIHKNKYEALLEHKQNRYINLMTGITGRESVFSFNMKDFPNLQWEIKKIPNASNELYRGLVDREVAFLPISHAKNITNLLFN